MIAFALLTLSVVPCFSATDNPRIPIPALIPEPSPESINGVSDDMLFGPITPMQYALPLQRDSGSYVYPKWTCPIPYTLDTTGVYGTALTADQQTQISDAMAYITSKTGWTFAVRTSGTDYLRFQNDGSGCNSYVGRLAGGYPTTGIGQPINLRTTCSTGSIVHEIGHAMGIKHEHVRPDRDTYVTINEANICCSAEGNFEIDTRDTTGTFNPGDYDWNSIMHYDQWAFDVDPSIKTIEPKITIPSDVCYIGQRAGLSPDDIVHYNFLIDGAHCNTPTITCDSTHIQVCGADTAVNGGNSIFGDYEVGGTSNGKTYYVSLLSKIGADKLYIYWTGSYWYIYTTLGGGSAYAYLPDGTGDNLLDTTGWTRSGSGVDNAVIATQLCTTTGHPSSTPTKFPTKYPTDAPTTKFPTKFPTKAPAEYPTQSPIPSPSPTNNPLQMPTQSPSNNPTEPSQMPTTANPTSATPQPTAVPTYVPTAIVENESMEFAAALFESGEMSEFGGMPNQNHKYSINLLLNVSNVLMVWILVLAVSVAFGIWVCFCYEKKQNVTVQLNEIP